VFLVTATVALYAIHAWSKSVDVQQNAAQSAAAQQQSTSSTNAALTAALQRAQASGDTITAQTIANTLRTTAASPQTGAPMTQLEQWATSHALWIGGGLAALLILPGLFEGGGRRRR
jgi:hypothetical protein